MSYQLGIVKSVGEKDVILSDGKKEHVIPLTIEDAKGLHHMLLSEDEVLIPFNEKEKKLCLNLPLESEYELEELQGDDDYEVDEEGKVL